MLRVLEDADRPMRADEIAKAVGGDTTGYSVGAALGRWHADKVQRVPQRGTGRVRYWLLSRGDPPAP